MNRIAKLSAIEAKLFLREPLTVVVTYAFPLVMLFVLAEVFGSEVAVDDDTGRPLFLGVPPTDYYESAYVALAAAGIGLVSLPVHLASYRELGVVRRFRASGFSATTVIGAQFLVTLGMSLAGGVLVVAACTLVYGTRAPEQPVQAMVAFLLVTVAFSAIGILLGAVLPSARAAQGAGILAFFVMLLLGGAGPPPEVMSAGMRHISDALPLTHAIRLIQHPWLGLGWDWTATLVLGGFLLGCAALAVRFFRWE